MKYIFSVLILGLSLCSLGATYECTSNRGYEVGAPKTFQIEKVRGENRGKLTGELSTRNSYTPKIRETTIYGKFTDYDFGDHVELAFHSDGKGVYDVDGGKMSYYTIRVDDGFQRDAGEFGGYIAINTLRANIECREIK